MTQYEFLRKIADALFEDPDDLTLQTNLDELLGWDSLGRLGVTALFNEEFDKKVDTLTLKSCKTIGDIADLVEKIRIE